ncbi:MAG: protein kinase [Pyrinomonadaceae bacterium]|nr:protein kinase [Pyrinomonadaceae bacterium]
MKICPTCQRCYEDTETICADDATKLASSAHGSRIINEKYRLDRRLGRGGMGAVYSGTHLELDRPVAIKMLLPDYVTDVNALERFRREARAAARLNHQNVADVYDYGVLPDGGAYIVMELINGETLREHMNKSCPLPFAEADTIARQVAEGIDAAHRSHIVHRDLKPSNIILARDHQNQIVAKVVDFGIAKLKEATFTEDGAITNTGMLIGTPRYMSPEQCAGLEIDARSDIYTLGIILYEMLGCRPPFDAPSATAIALKHVQELPPPLTNFRSDVPPALAAVVMQALEKDPRQRQQTAADFARQLRDAESTLPTVLAHTPTGLAAATTTDYDSPLVLHEERDAHTTNRPTDYSTDSRISEPETNRSGLPTVEEPLDLGENEEAQVSAFAAPEASVENSVAASLQTSQSVGATVAPQTYSSPAQFTSPSSASNSGREKYLLGAGLLLAFLFGSIAVWLFMRDPQVDRNAAVYVPPQSSAPGSTERAPSSNVAVSNPTQSTQINANNAALNSSQELAALQSSLDAWVAATNARDVNKQMSFYTSTIARYYTRPYASQDFVRADKMHSIGNASSVEMRVRDTQIEIAPNGRTATMRFLKQYAIVRDGNTSRGEVLSELEWLKTADGWKINSERDLRVIS